MLHAFQAVLGRLVVPLAPMACFLVEGALNGALDEEMGTAVSPQKIWDAAELLIVFEFGPLLLNVVCCGLLLRHIRISSLEIQQRNAFSASGANSPSLIMPTISRSILCWCARCAKSLK